jgi:hypothetical protein
MSIWVITLTMWGERHIEKGRERGDNRGTMTPILVLLFYIVVILFRKCYNYFRTIC